MGFENYFGRVMAIDASSHIYQFMAVVGRQGGQTLTNDNGEVTSHLQGMFFRTVRMVEAGVKPVYVFDGKPPDLKSGELMKRRELREKADAELAKAKEAGAATEEVEKFAKRTFRVTRKQNEECKRLLHLMGVPVIEAPCEAEATCAALCAAKKCYSVASEDMDTLTFASPMLTRNMMTTDKPLLEFNHEKAIAALDVTHAQFIDICILCGCDYCDSIRGIGPKTAVTLIKKHGSIEEVLKYVDKDKYHIPADWPFAQARRLFLAPEVIDVSNIGTFKWEAPDETALVDFLVTEKTFNEDRVRKGIEKLNKARVKKQQGRLETFFGSTTVHSSTLGKRKDESNKGKGKVSAGAMKKGKLGVIKR